MAVREVDMSFAGSQIWKCAAGHSRYEIISCPQIDRTDRFRAVDRKLAVPLSYPLSSCLPGRNGRCRARATHRRWRPPLSPLPPSSRLFPPQTPVSECPSEPPFAVSPSQPPRPLRAPLRRRGSAGASWSGTGSTPTTSRMTRRRTQGKRGGGIGGGGGGRGEGRRPRRLRLLRRKRRSLGRLTNCFRSGHKRFLCQCFGACDVINRISLLQNHTTT